MKRYLTVKNFVPTIMGQKKPLVNWGELLDKFPERTGTDLKDKYGYIFKKIVRYCFVTYVIYIGT